MNHTVDLTGNFAGGLHSVLSEAAEKGPLAVDVATGATVVLRQRDLEALAHDQRLEGIGLALFDMMGITDGPLRDWYGQLMFTTEGELSPPHAIAGFPCSKSLLPQPPSQNCVRAWTS